MMSIHGVYTRCYRYGVTVDAKRDSFDDDAIVY